MVAKTRDLTLIPVMLCFFAMGFVDLVGIASNYVKEDLQLTDSVANIFPSLVFFWFLIFSVPTGMLMNKLGRKNTVMLSLIVTILSLLIPLFGENFTTMLIAFSLLGIGNALMQTSLNPLVATVMDSGRSQDNHLASTLTFGQFIKAIASFLAPYLAMWGATHVIPTFGRLACTLRHLLLGGYLSHCDVGGHTYSGGREPAYWSTEVCHRAVNRLFQTFRHPHRITHVFRHHMSCRHRRGYEHHSSENSDGAPRHQSERCCLCHESLLHLPHHRLSLGLVYLTHTAQPYLLHYQRVDDGTFDVRPVLRQGSMDTLYSHCPGGVWQLKHFLHLLCPGTDLDARETE